MTFQDPYARNRIQSRSSTPTDNALLRQIRNALFLNAVILTITMFIVAGNL